MRTKSFDILFSQALCFCLTTVLEAAGFAAGFAAERVAAFFTGAFAFDFLRAD
jgi:hypothetical protein